MSVNSKLKATKIIGQRKGFYGQRIPEPNCARKETVDSPEKQSCIFVFVVCLTILSSN